MKKILLFILCIIVLATFSYVIFVNAGKELLTNDEALALGEEKYLEFLWMVDGAFNDSRFDKSFIVNNKNYNKEYDFSCTYSKKNKNSCVSKNFTSAFDNIFVSSIKYDDVYSDGISFSWYKKEKDNFIFTNINTCNVKRMSVNHFLSVKKIEKNRITYEVSFFDKEDGLYETHKAFILEYDSDKWKIAKAYYHDLCYMDYYIG